MPTKPKPYYYTVVGFNFDPRTRFETFEQCFNVLLAHMGDHRIVRMEQQLAGQIKFTSFVIDDRRFQGGACFAIYAHRD